MGVGVCVGMAGIVGAMAGCAARGVAVGTGVGRARVSVGAGVGGGVAVGGTVGVGVGNAAAGVGVGVGNAAAAAPLSISDAPSPQETNATAPTVAIITGQHHNSYDPADHEYISPLLQTVHHIMPHVPLQCNCPRLRVVFCYGRLDFLRLKRAVPRTPWCRPFFELAGGRRLSTFIEDNLFVNMSSDAGGGIPAYAGMTEQGAGYDVMGRRGMTREKAGWFREISER